MKCFLLCVLTVLLSGSALARGNVPTVNVTPAPYQNIVYSKNVPLSVSSLMPTGAKSVFWALFSPKNSEGEVVFSRLGLHLYQLWDAEEPHEARNTLHFALDIFDETNPKHPHLINHAFASGVYGWAPDRFGMRFYWLDPKECTRPLFVIQGYIQGDYGPAGQEHFIVLGSGWQGRATDDSWSFGSWHASGTLGQQNTVFVNADGQLAVRSIAFATTDELSQQQLDASYSANFVWDSDGFHPVGITSDAVRWNIGFGGWGRNSYKH